MGHNKREEVQQHCHRRQAAAARLTGSRSANAAASAWKSARLSMLPNTGALPKDTTTTPAGAPATKEPAAGGARGPGRGGRGAMGPISAWGCIVCICVCVCVVC